MKTFKAVNALLGIKMAAYVVAQGSAAPVSVAELAAEERDYVHATIGLAAVLYRQVHEAMQAHGVAWLAGSQCLEVLEYGSFTHQRLRLVG